MPNVAFVNDRSFGRKHACQGCGARFYDLNRAEPTCPKCGVAVSTKAAARGVSADVAPIHDEVDEPDLDARDLPLGAAAALGDDELGDDDELGELELDDISLGDDDDEDVDGVDDGELGGDADEDEDALGD
jgi:hypothetical protein